MRSLRARCCSELRDPEKLLSNEAWRCVDRRPVRQALDRGHRPHEYRVGAVAHEVVEREPPRTRPALHVLKAASSAAEHAVASGASRAPAGSISGRNVPRRRIEKRADDGENSVGAHEEFRALAFGSQWLDELRQLMLQEDMPRRLLRTRFSPIIRIATLRGRGVSTLARRCLIPPAVKKLEGQNRSAACR